MTAFDIMESWARVLSENADLLSWTEKTFGMPLSVGIGYDAVASFGRNRTPYVIMSPAGEETGPERNTLSWDIGLFLGIMLRSKDDVSGIISTNTSMQLMEKEFAPRVLEALDNADPDLVPGMAEGQTFPPRDGYCERQLILTVTIPNTFNLRHAPWR